MTLVLHNYFRSSTSFRVRAALALKGLDYDYVAYPLLDNAHRGPEHLALNPQGLVPTLQTPQGPVTQSLAILEWLEETYPDPPLLPADAWGRARVRSLAQMVALDIHPLNNLRVLRHIEAEFGADKGAWFRYWVDETFAPLEARLAGEGETGRFCHGDAISLADLCLVAQVVNNRRFGVDMAPYPVIARIAEAALSVHEVAGAAPERQPDAT